VVAINSPENYPEQKLLYFGAKRMVKFATQVIL
jgi:hypothetical protein